MGIVCAVRQNLQIVRPFSRLRVPRSNVSIPFFRNFEIVAGGQSPLYKAIDDSCMARFSKIGIKIDNRSSILCKNTRRTDAETQFFNEIRLLQDEARNEKTGFLTDKCVTPDSVKLKLFEIEIFDRRASTSPFFPSLSPQPDPVARSYSGLSADRKSLSSLERDRDNPSTPCDWRR